MNWESYYAFAIASMATTFLLIIIQNDWFYITIILSFYWFTMAGVSMYNNRR